VIGRDYRHTEVVFFLMPVKAPVQHNGSGPIRKHLAATRHERNEMGFVIALQMGQSSPVKGHQSFWS
jgi:hypothetical protein